MFGLGIITRRFFPPHTLQYYRHMGTGTTSIPTRLACLASGRPLFYLADISHLLRLLCVYGVSMQKRKTRQSVSAEAR